MGPWGLNIGARSSKLKFKMQGKDWIEFSEETGFLFMHPLVGTPKGISRLLMGQDGTPLGDGDLSSDEDPMGDSLG